METGRNDPCPCGSGKKYKRCCLAKGPSMPAQYKLILGLGGVIILVSLVMLIGSIRNF